MNLDANSHGQSFLRLFQSRFVPGGLYLLDEPEAPLSPQSQLGLIAMISEMVAQDAQFIVATHSPLLMAYPGATIVSFDHAPVARGAVRGARERSARAGLPRGSGDATCGDWLATRRDGSDAPPAS